MNAEVKLRWQEALRSGKYEQTKGYLRDENGYCCLGVLCDLYDPELWRKGDLFYSFKAEDVALPLVVVNWAGLAESNPSVVINYDDGLSPIDLASANDDGHAFEEIADLIDQL